MNNKMLIPPSWWKHSVDSWTQLTKHFDNKNLAEEDNWLSVFEGQSNANYRLTIQKELFFIQVVNSGNYALLPSLKTVTTFHQDFSESQLSPWLVNCYLATEKLRIYSWVENDGCNNSRFNNPAFCKSLVNFLINLHSFSVNQTTKIIKLDMEEYLFNYQKLALEKTPYQKAEIEQLFKLATQLCSEFIPTSLCHNDLSYGNLLWNQQQKLKVIDWEYACFSDPVMDLASLIVNCQLNQQQEFLLIQGYCQGSNRAICKNKLANMKQLCQIISKLWLLAQN